MSDELLCGDRVMWVDNDFRIRFGELKRRPIQMGTDQQMMAMVLPDGRDQAILVDARGMQREPSPAVATPSRFGLFHRHHWAETSRAFNEPRATGHIETARVDDFLVAAHGITVVELRCGGCGDVKAVRYAGRAA